MTYSITEHILHNFFSQSSHLFMTSQVWRWKSQVTCKVQGWVKYMHTWLVQTYQLNTSTYMYHIFNLCACMNACRSKTSCSLSTVLSLCFLSLCTYLWPQYFCESSSWLTCDIASITDHISVVSVHTAWIWYTIIKSHGDIRQKTNCELQGEPRTMARVHEIFGEYLTLDVTM